MTRYKKVEMGKYLMLHVLIFLGIINNVLQKTSRARWQVFNLISCLQKKMKLLRFSFKSNHNVQKTFKDIMCINLNKREKTIPKHPFDVHNRQK